MTEDRAKILIEFAIQYTHLRGRSHITSAAGGGGGVSQKLTIADKGGGGGKPKADNC